jgi:hypothetical protein
VVLMPPGAELTRLLHELRPAELALRDWVRTRLNASIVREMAHLDYGMQVEEHQQGIEELLVARRLPENLPWPAGAVLSLSSGEEPADLDLRPGSEGWRRHVARLFSCLVIVRTNDMHLPAGILTGLVESALALGPEATDHAVRYLAWCRLHEPGAWRDDDEALPFLTLGLLLLYVMAPGGGDVAVTAGLTRAFAGEVQALLPEQWWPDQPLKSALKQTAGGPGWRVWLRLVDRCLINGAGSHDESLALLGRAMCGQVAVTRETLQSWATTQDRFGPPHAGE